MNEEWTLEERVELFIQKVNELQQEYGVRFDDHGYESELVVVDIKSFKSLDIVFCSEGLEVHKNPLSNIDTSLLNKFEQKKWPETNLDFHRN